MNGRGNNRTELRVQSQRIVTVVKLPPRVMQNMWQPEPDTYDHMYLNGMNANGSNSNYVERDPNPFRRPHMAYGDPNRHGVVHDAYPAINWGPANNSLGFNQNLGPRVNWSTTNQNFNMNGGPGSLVNWQSAIPSRPMWPQNHMNSNVSWSNCPPPLSYHSGPPIVRFVDPNLASVSSITSNSSSNGRDERFAGRLGPSNLVARDPSPKKLAPAQTSTNLRQINLSSASANRQQSAPSSSQARAPSSTTTTSAKPSSSRSKSPEINHHPSGDLNQHVVPCYSMDHQQRYYIHSKDLPRGLTITDKIQDSHFNTSKGWLHFGKNRYVEVMDIMKALPYRRVLGHPLMPNGERVSFTPEVMRQLKERAKTVRAHPGLSSGTMPPQRSAQPKTTSTPVVPILVDLTDSPQNTTSAKTPTRCLPSIPVSVPQTPGSSTKSKSTVTTPQGSSSSSTPKSTPKTQTKEVSSSEKKRSATKVPYNPDAWKSIPGYEIIEYLVEPYFLKKSTSGSGSCYKKFEVLLSTVKIAQLYEKGSTLVVLLRLILTKARTKKVVEDKLTALKLTEIEVNRKLLKITKKEGYRYTFDITAHVNGCRASTVGVSAKVDKRYEKDLDILCYVGLARKSDAKQMLEQLMIRSQISKEQTRKLITDSFKEAAESGILINESKLTLSLKCPLGKALITIPCRGMFCDHYTCFDGSNFLQLYAKHNNWICPICDAGIDREDLIIDSFFQNILKSVQGNEDCKVEINADGEFSVSNQNQTIAKPAIVTQKVDVSLMVVSDGEDDGVEMVACINNGYAMEDRQVEELPPPPPLPRTEVSKQDSTFVMYIPGFDVIQHLIATDHTIISRSGLGKYYKIFDVTLTQIQLRQILEPESQLLVVLHWYLIESGVNSNDNNKLVIREVRVNSELIELTKTVGYRFDIDITPYLKGTEDNNLSIKGETDKSIRSTDLDIFCNVTIVKIPSDQELLNRLLAKPKIPQDQTLKLITDQLTDAIGKGLLRADSKLHVSLICPISETQMEIPCRGINCEHFACFDAMNCLTIYWKTIEFPCPVCESILRPEDLRVDGYLENLLRSIHNKGNIPDDWNHKVLVDINGVHHVFSAPVATANEFDAVPPLVLETETLPLRTHGDTAVNEDDDIPPPLPETEAATVTLLSTSPTPEDQDTLPSTLHSREDPDDVRESDAGPPSPPSEPETEEVPLPLSLPIPEIEESDDDDDIAGRFTEKQIQDNVGLAILLDNHETLKKLKLRLKSLKRTGSMNEIAGMMNPANLRRISQDSSTTLNEWKALEQAEKLRTQGMEFFLREPRDIDYELYDLDVDNFTLTRNDRDELPIPMNVSDDDNESDSLEVSPSDSQNAGVTNTATATIVPEITSGASNGLSNQESSTEQFITPNDSNTSEGLVENAPEDPQISLNSSGTGESAESEDALQGCSSANPLGRKLRSIIRTKRKLNFDTNSEERPSTSTSTNVSPVPAPPACKKIAFSS